METEFKNHDRLLFSLFTREGGGESGGKGQFSRSLKSKKKESHQRESSREEPEELAIAINKKKKRKKKQKGFALFSLSLSFLRKETTRVSGNGRSRAFWGFRFSPAFFISTLLCLP